MRAQRLYGPWRAMPPPDAEPEHPVEVLVLAALYDAVRLEPLTLRPLFDVIAASTPLRDADADRVLRALIDRGYLAVGAVDDRLAVAVSDEGVDWLAARLW